MIIDGAKDCFVPDRKWKNETGLLVRCSRLMGIMEGDGKGLCLTEGKQWLLLIIHYVHYDLCEKEIG